MDDGHTIEHMVRSQNNMSCIHVISCSFPIWNSSDSDSRTSFQFCLKNSNQKYVLLGKGCKSTVGCLLSMFKVLGLGTSSKTQTSNYQSIKSQTQNQAKTPHNQKAKQWKPDSVNCPCPEWDFMLRYCRDSNFEGGFHGALSVPSLLPCGIYGPEALRRPSCD